MTSARSASDPATSSFELLHPKVQRWVWQQGWTQLHEAQDRAIPPIITGERDVLIGAATAAGKTEAAFLPICSNLMSEQPAGTGVDVLCLSPLKALINDQFRRVEEMCEGLGISTHRWHGDVAMSRKAALLKNPGGILLITPESLEAMFVRRGTKLAGMFGGLRYVVIDELHSFLGTERGTQLVSQLHRLELVTGAPVPRVGLSATLGDMSIAAEQLRPGAGDQVIVINSASGGQDLRLQVRGCRNDELLATEQIAEHLHQVMRGSTNLVFANTRNSVEEYASRLGELADRKHVPNEFHPHHGSLAKELREDVEALLRDPARPATAVCTSTLEMGIDIGDIAQVAQVGPPPTVAALRQRLGRSGRRDRPSVLRAYAELTTVGPNTPPLDRLHIPLVQTVAAVELLRERWCEPPVPTRLDLSTLIQQLLSMIAQYGGVRPERAYRALCGAGGPFAAVTRDQFAALLRDLAARDVLSQLADRTLLAGEVGDREVNDYTFYAAFVTPEEYRLVHGDTTLGAHPVADPLRAEQLIAFAGRRWRVVAVHEEDKVIQVVPAGAGNPELKGVASGAVHATVRARMRAILGGDETFDYLDETAAKLLGQARRGYAELRLDERTLIRDGATTLILPWTGDRELSSLCQILNAASVETEQDGIALRVSEPDPDKVRESLRTIVDGEPPDDLEVARHVLNKRQAKYDQWLGDELLSVQYASSRLDCAAALLVAKAVVAGG